MARSTPRFDPARDYHLGQAGAGRVMMLYGDYSSEACRRLRDILSRIAGRLQRQVVFVYRQCPAPGNAEAELAARAALAAGAQGRFWDMHARLYGRGQGHDRAAIAALAGDLGLDAARFAADMDSADITDRLTYDRDAASSDGMLTVPRLYIDGEPYHGAWDELAILEAVERPLGVRVEDARQRFFSWAAAGGFVLVMATLLALLVANIGYHGAYEAFRMTPLALAFGEAVFAMPLETWINDGLMAVFFLIVGIEIKREIVSGELSDLGSAMLPIMGAVGGMAVPAAIYVALNAGGAAVHGWGVPMATDIAFTLGLMALLGRRVPNSLKVFVSALAIADDLGAIVVIALFYGHGFHLQPALGALACLAVMGVMSRGRVYSLTPYLILGVVLWAMIHASGLHATLAGVLTAAMIPSRPSANMTGVATQATEVFRAAIDDEDTGHRRVPPAAFAMLENALLRLREPGVHLQHALENWTSFLILPLFAFFNTGVLVVGSAFSPLEPASLGVIVGLAVGKPLGIVLTCWVAVSLGWARLSAEISWRQLLGAGCLAGVGFTMSIFIATAAFDGAQLESVKLSVLIGSVISAGLGMTILSRAPRRAGEGDH